MPPMLPSTCRFPISNLKWSNLELALMGTIQTTCNFALFERWGSLYLTAVLFGMRFCFFCGGICTENRMDFKLPACFSTPTTNLRSLHLLEQGRQNAGSQYIGYITLIQLRKFGPMTLRGNLAVQRKSRHPLFVFFLLLLLTFATYLVTACVLVIVVRQSCTKHSCTLSSGFLLAPL